MCLFMQYVEKNCLLFFLKKYEEINRLNYVSR